jgi:hypothetical protein
LKQKELKNSIKKANNKKQKMNGLRERVTDRKVDKTFSFSASVKNYFFNKTFLLFLFTQIARKNLLANCMQTQKARKINRKNFIIM